MIAPDHTSKLALESALAKAPAAAVSTEPLIHIYSIKLFESTMFGPSVQVFTTGCPYRCAMCWVHQDALGARKGSEFLTHKIETRLPEGLKDRSIGRRTADDSAAIHRTLEDSGIENVD